MALLLQIYPSLQFVFLITVVNIYATEDIPGLHYFETVDVVHINSRVQRSLEGSEEIVKYVSFQGFNRSYQVRLKPGTDVLTTNFEAKIINADESATVFHVDVNQFFSGHLVDVPDVIVNGHMEDNMISLTIYDHEEIYSLEPAKIYRKREKKQWNLADNSWIMYKLSDTDLLSPKDYFNFDAHSNAHFCGINTSNMNNDTEGHEDFNLDLEVAKAGANNSSRGKRGLSRNTCYLMTVVTHNVFISRCFENRFACAAFVVSSVDFADKVLSRTLLGPLSGIRLQLEEMFIHVTPVADNTYKNGRLHYNVEQPVWNYNKLLDSFTYQVFRRTKYRHCINFLFCAHIITGNVLGLAFIGRTCAWSNTGFATLVTKDNEAIMTARVRILFVHELGHLFGSHHDPDTHECNPPTNKGGPYTMWPFILTGHCVNCEYYSPCSRRFIIDSLRRDGPRRCFQTFDPNKGICGNGKIEANEECDEGRKLSNACCTSKCRLLSHATCSDINSQCCHKCQTAPKGLQCSAYIEGLCVGNSYCSGSSLECPQPPRLEDGHECRSYGQCWGGVCKDYCYTIGKKNGSRLESCLCKKPADACKLCCYEANDPLNLGECIPYSDSLVLEDNRPCYFGTCQKGTCVTTEVSTRSQILQWLSGIDLSAAVRFMQANVVMFVVVLSLLVWIPASCIISYFDTKERREMEEEAEAYPAWKTECVDYLNEGEGREVTFKISETETSQGAETDKTFSTNESQEEEMTEDEDEKSSEKGSVIKQRIVSVQQ